MFIVPVNLQSVLFKIYKTVPESEIINVVLIYANKTLLNIISYFS